MAVDRMRHKKWLAVTIVAIMCLLCIIYKPSGRETAVMRGEESSGPNNPGGPGGVAPDKSKDTRITVRTEAPAADLIPVRQSAAATTAPVQAKPRTNPAPEPAAEAVEVIATGYYAGVESTGKHRGHPSYGITYSGVKVRRGAISTVAADPRVFPIGTLLHIPGYGYGIVADTGSAIKGNKLDLYFETKQQVYSQWGKRKVKVVVLRRGSGKVTEAMLDRLDDELAQKKSKANENR